MAAAHGCVHLCDDETNGQGVGACAVLRGLSRPPVHVAGNTTFRPTSVVYNAAGCEGSHSVRLPIVRRAGCRDTHRREDAPDGVMSAPAQHAAGLGANPGPRAQAMESKSKNGMVPQTVWAGFRVERCETEELDWMFCVTRRVPRPRTVERPPQLNARGGGREHAAQAAEV